MSAGFRNGVFNTAGDHEPINPVLFLDTPWPFFAGAVITGSELHEALGNLSEHQLITYIETEPVTVAITTQGVSCALAGGSVQDHINRQREGKPPSWSRLPKTVELEQGECN
ncbi:hypothetical protein [Streptomyces sp. AC555_RSS877]|uniref:hypothetical protein n=1 Tax=Streptomyces sp. AC555_RSS877 TaxID=2823688 RepID=UPI001C26B77C|nr:hypothetical protein [Streptomyces sp. AC555_RSS877]